MSTTCSDCYTRSEAPRGTAASAAIRRAVTALQSDRLDDQAARRMALDILSQLAAAAKDIHDTGSPAPWRSLSERERDVLECLVTGSSNREIGQQLYIAESTVRFHVSNILRKLGMRTRAEVIALMLR